MRRSLDVDEFYRDCTPDQRAACRAWLVDEGLGDMAPGTIAETLHDHGAVGITKVELVSEGRARFRMILPAENAVVATMHGEPIIFPSVIFLERVFPIRTPPPFIGWDL